MIVFEEIFIAVKFAGKFLYKEVNAWVLLHPNSAIHKAASLTIPDCSMTLPQTIPENLLSHEWGWLAAGTVSEVVPIAGRRLCE